MILQIPPGFAYALDMQGSLRLLGVDLDCTCGADDGDSDRAADIAADRREIARGLR